MRDGQSYIRRVVLILLFNSILLFIPVTSKGQLVAGEGEGNPTQPKNATAVTAKPDTTDADADDEIEVGARSIGGFPVIFYSDQTSTAGGGGVQIVYKGETERQNSSIMLLAFYTQNKQYAFQVGGEFYLKNGLYKLTGSTGYSYFPDAFYGIGNNVSLESENYTNRLFSIQPILQKKVKEELWVGAQWGFFHANQVEVDSSDDGMLLHGNILGSDGGLISGPGITVTWDTRDNNIYPTSGSFHNLTIGNTAGIFGSDFSFTAVVFDLRNYRTIFGDKILAMKGIVGMSFQDVPFQAMWNLGTHLRGYQVVRFRDRKMIAYQAEYRQHLFWRFGYIVSGGFGQLADEIGDFSLGEFKPSVGFGLRFMLIPEHKVNLRFDLGIGKDDGSFDISLGEAF